MGKVDYEMTKKKESSRTFSRSLFVCEDVKEGDVITHKNIKSVRPNKGLHPKHFDEVIGKTFTKGVTNGTPLSFDIIK